MKDKEKILGITHNGKFHADEVFATAFLMLAFKDYNFVWKRVSQVPSGYNDDTPNVIIYDIGNGKYNHHSDDKSKKRSDGTKYSAFGLIFKQFGRQLLGDNFELFDKKFVQPIDMTDNYGQDKYPNPMSAYISSLNPLTDSDKESSDRQFEKAVLIAKDMLERMFMTMVSKKNTDGLLREKINKSDKCVLVLDKYLPWQNVVINESEIKFVIFPSPREGYNLQTVPSSFNTQKSPRIPFPDQWYSTKGDGTLKNSDLVKKDFTGIIFWNRSFACFRTRDNAISAAYRLINMYNEQNSNSLGSYITPVSKWK